MYIITRGKAEEIAKGKAKKWFRRILQGIVDKGLKKK